MTIEDEAAIANRRLWEREVEKGCGFTIPWLDLDAALLRRFAGGEIQALPEPFDCIAPANVLAGVEGKDVLCLASGGGQQSAVFGLLGARVAVIDLAEGQLQGDRRAAEHYGYADTARRGDMRDLSFFADASFDLVYQADSLSYVPDVRQVYGEVARVLRRGGRYRTVLYQPAVQYIKWDGRSYCIAQPYAEPFHRRADGGIEFKHYIDDVFNGLIDAGLALTQVVDICRDRQPRPDAEPGSWEHEYAYVGGKFIIVAVRS